MAKRQDSGSDSSHEDERPEPHNEDRIPEFTDNVRGRAEDDDVDDLEVDDEDMEEDDEEEGTI